MDEYEVIWFVFQLEYNNNNYYYYTYAYLRNYNQIAITKKSRERQSLNRAFRADLRLDAGAYTYTSYGLNTAPSSLIGSKRVDVKGETSRPTLSIFLQARENYPTT